MPEGLRFDDDGTATVAWDEYEVKLRRPKLREYRSFIEEQEQARTALETLVVGEGDAAVLRDIDIMGSDEEPGPYLRLWVRILFELGAEEIAPGDLAVWMAPGATFGQLVSHWRTNPLAPGGIPTRS